MALYLGKQKVSAKVNVKVTPEESIHYATGTVISDDKGVITFPELSFTPKIITVWNVSQIDLLETWDPENDGEFLDTYVRYLYAGTMLMAVNVDGHWVSQGLTGCSGEVNITSNSYEGFNGTPTKPPSGIFITNGLYNYHLCIFAAEVDDVIAGIEDGSPLDIANAEFNYAIYG